MCFMIAIAKVSVRTMAFGNILINYLVNKIDVTIMRCLDEMSETIFWCLKIMVFIIGKCAGFLEFVSM